MPELSTLGLRISKAIAPYEDAQRAVISRTLTEPPTGVALGSRYIVALHPVGAWVGHDNQIAQREASGWKFIDVVAGMTAWVQAEGRELVFSGTEWIGGGAGGLLSLSNKAMPARTTTHDYERACDIAMQRTPAHGASVSVYVNGMLISGIGDGVKEDVPCYFSGDGGFTPRLLREILAGDVLYWNGSVAGWQIAQETDIIDFVYEVP